MSKTIKVTDEVYQELEGFLELRETFSQVIERVLRVFKTIRDVSDNLTANHYLHSKRPPSKTMQEDADAVRRDIEARTL